MRLLTFCHLGEPRIGLLLEGDLVLDLVEAKRLLPAAADIPNSVLEVLESGDTALNALKNCLEEANRDIGGLQNIGAVIPLGEVSLLPPIVKPGLILSIGLNYWKHLEEMEMYQPPNIRHPLSKLKARYWGQV
jgi:2-keto-4-pentenoate hydratase/2-oxohepta-3-ene-1,7-dioic acid hydratase in catechol pathway